MAVVTRRVSVRRNPLPDRDERPWLVHCDYCAGDDTTWLTPFFVGRGLLGWALRWRDAQDFAVRHALAHEARRCTTCLHVPTGPLPKEAGV